MRSWTDFLLESMTLDDAKKIFGLNVVSSKDDVVKLYRKLSMQNHPDRGGSNEKMAEINQAKELLLKNIGSGTKFSPVKSATDDDEEKKAAEIIDKTMSKFDPEIYKKYIEKAFGRTFFMKVDRKNSTLRQGYKYGTAAHIDIEIYDENRDIVFSLSISPYESMLSMHAWNFFHKASLGASNNLEFEIYMHSNVLVNGKKQVLQKYYNAHTSDKAIFIDPSILIPKAKLTKIAQGKARANSKVSKRDFEALMELKLKGKQYGKNSYLITFNDGKNGVVISRQAYGGSFFTGLKRTDKFAFYHIYKFVKLKPYVDRKGVAHPDMPIEVELGMNDAPRYSVDYEDMLESRESLDHMCKILQKLQKDGNMKAFAKEFRDKNTEK